ncbi:MAG TPA: arginine decarboxylase, pyruvoyl-dependent [Gemmatimonadota bacterium]|nr:arginine decarboxylase, pyruvoyl-dependent [Gemmatimonadota bacterium]
MPGANPFVATKIFLTKGVGTHRERLSAFEMALRDAQIARYNLVNVSSIFPPHCELIELEEGIELLSPGQIVFAVMSRLDTNEPSRLIASSIGVAIPKEPSQFGYLSEHHEYGQNDQTAGDYAEDLAASMLATILGVPFNPDTAWDEQRAQWQVSGKIVKTSNITQTAEGPDDGKWVSVVTAAVLLP